MASERTLPQDGLRRRRLEELLRIRSVSVPVALALFVVGALLVRIWLTRKIATPWIMVDELVYTDLSRSLEATGSFLVRGHAASASSLVYPAVIAPAWLAHSTATAYGLAKAINVVVMSLAAVPVYFWGKRLVSATAGAIAAGLVLLMPSYLYTGMLMTENAFFPTFLLACFACALALERPTLWRQAFALAAIVLAGAARAQAGVFVIVLPTAVVLKLLFDLRIEPAGSRTRLLRGDLFRQLRLPLVLLVGAGAYAIAKGILQKGSLSGPLGTYHDVIEANYSFAAARHWVPLHFAELGLSVGVFPMSALILLVGLALWRGLPGSAERAFVAIAASSVLWFVIEVGLYASRFSFRIEERNMFCLAPLLLLALVLWIARGMPRPPVLAAIAALVPALLILKLDLTSLLNVSILSDTFSLIPLLRLSQLLAAGTPRVELLLNLAGFAAAAAFVFVPRRVARFALPLAVAGFFLLSSYSIFGAVRDFSQQTRAAAGGADPQWVDSRIKGGEQAAFLFGTTADPASEANVLWQTEFWNRRLSPVLDLVTEPGGFPQVPSAIDRVTGRVTTNPANLSSAVRYVVVSDGFHLSGRLVASHPPLALYQVHSPLRLASAVDGLYADGWMSSLAGYSVYASGGHAGRVFVSVSRAAWRGPDKPGRVVIEVGPQHAGQDGLPAISRVTASRRWVIHSGRRKLFSLPTPPAPFRVFVSVDPTFSPAAYGEPDTRQLGAQVQFSFVPG